MPHLTSDDGRFTKRWIPVGRDIYTVADKEENKLWVGMCITPEMADRIVLEHNCTLLRQRWDQQKRVEDCKKDGHVFSLYGETCTHCDATWVDVQNDIDGHISPDSYTPHPHLATLTPYPLSVREENENK